MNADTCLQIRWGTISGFLFLQNFSLGMGLGMENATSMAATAWALCGCANQAALSTAAKFGMANPASVFCMPQGGKLRLEKTAPSAQGACILPDGCGIGGGACYRERH